MQLFQNTKLGKSGAGFSSANFWRWLIDLRFHISYAYSMSYKITDSRLTKLSDISSDIAQIFFASAFIGPLFSDKTNWRYVVIGLLFSTVAWIGSLLLTKE